MRIATSQYYSSSTKTMDNQQSQLLQLEQELSTGTALSTPADNPVGASQAVSLSVTSAALTQYSSNQTSALSSLRSEDVALSSTSKTMQNALTLVQEAQNGTFSDADRDAIASQLSGVRSQLMTLANTSDGMGNYIFAGFQPTAQPFSDKAGGGVTYTGDEGQQLVQVSGTRQMAVNDSGARVFMTVPPFGTSAVASGSMSNTGTGTVGAVSITDPISPNNDDTWKVTFGGTDDAPTYSVTDTTTNTVYSSDQPYTADSAIDVGGGMSIEVSGTPAAGDTFDVAPATKATTDVFKTLDDAIAALRTPVGSSNALQASMTNTLNAAMTQLNNSIVNVVTVQASVGGREQELQALQTTVADNQLQTTSNLQDLTGTNMVQTISQYQQVQNALTASQKSFVQIQQLSLFQYLNT